MFSPIKESGERILLTFGVHWVLGLVNPGIDKEKWAVKETLWAAYKYILPGVESPALSPFGVGHPLHHLR